MSSLQRKLARKQKKESKKLEKKIASQIAQFGQLPNKCLTCEKNFDKKNKEQAMTWRVVVHEESVRLYCDDCWDNACNVLEDYMEKKNGNL